MWYLASRKRHNANGPAARFEKKKEKEEKRRKIYKKQTAGRAWRGVMLAMMKKIKNIKNIKDGQATQRHRQKTGSSSTRRSSQNQNREERIQLR